MRATEADRGVAAPLLLGHRSVTGDDHPRRRTEARGGRPLQGDGEREKGRGRKPSSPGARRGGQRRQGRSRSSESSSAVAVRVGEDALDLLVSERPST